MFSIDHTDNQIINIIKNDIIHFNTNEIILVDNFLHNIKDDCFWKMRMMLILTENIKEITHKNINSIKDSINTINITYIDSIHTIDISDKQLYLIMNWLYILFNTFEAFKRVLKLFMTNIEIDLIHDDLKSKLIST